MQPMSRKPNRREYFRVDDQVLLKIKLLGNHDNFSTPPADYFEESTSITLVEQLRIIDNEHNKLLRPIAEINRDLELYLKSINKKIDLIANSILDLHQPAVHQAYIDVSISEGGLAFNVTQHYATNSICALLICLQPENTCFAAYAEVLECAALPGGDHRVALQFIKLNTADQQLLARHILQVQIAQKKEKSNS